MEDEEFSYYITHIVRPKGSVFLKSGEKVKSLFIQVISSSYTTKKVVCWIEGSTKKFFKVKDCYEFISVVKSILSLYNKFEFEILTFDKAYNADLSFVIVDSFISGFDNIQENIDLFNIKNDLK